jgi:hypothetical protein
MRFMATMGTSSLIYATAHGCHVEDLRQPRHSDAVPCLLINTNGPPREMAWRLPRSRGWALIGFAVASFGRLILLPIVDISKQP